MWGVWAAMVSNTRRQSISVRSSERERERERERARMRESAQGIEK